MFIQNKCCGSHFLGGRPLTEPSLRCSNVQLVCTYLHPKHRVLPRKSEIDATFHQLKGQRSRRMRARGAGHVSDMFLGWGRSYCLHNSSKEMLFENIWASLRRPQQKLKEHSLPLPSTLSPAHRNDDVDSTNKTQICRIPWGMPVARHLS